MRAGTERLTGRAQGCYSRGVRPVGKVNPLSVLFILAIAAGLYWVVIFLPFYLDNMEVKDAVSVAFNAFGGEFDTAKVRYDMKNKFLDAKWGVHEELDPVSGEVKEMPGLPIPDEQITIEYDEARDLLTVRVVYDREVILRPTQKKRVLHFVVEKVGKPLKAPSRR